jgi:hypothetical protein
LTTLPVDLQQIIDAADAADREADDIAAGLSDAQFFWRPDAGRAWSVALCLDHLATANVVYTNAMKPAVEEGRARNWTRRDPIRSNVFGRWFISTMEPPPRRGRRTTAPGKIQPAPARSRDEIMRAYREAHDRVRALAHESAGLDVNRATFTNPFIQFVRVRLGTGFRIMAAHDRRHLWQARRVTEREEFPR